MKEGRWSNETPLGDDPFRSVPLKARDRDFCTRGAAEFI